MEGDINNLWEKVAEIIIIMANKFMERSRGKIVGKNTWWWNKKTQKVISTKKKCKNLERT